MIRNIINRLKQFFCVTLELVGCSFIITYCTNYFAPIITSWEFIERMVFGYGIYQIFVYIILTNCNDIRKDSYLALLTNYKMLDLYYCCNDNEIKKKITKNIEYQLDKATLNDKDICNEYENLLQLIDNRNDIQVKVKIILFEHLMEAATLNWKYSFLLRILK